MGWMVVVPTILTRRQQKVGQPATPATAALLGAGAGGEPQAAGADRSAVDAPISEQRREVHAIHATVAVDVTLGTEGPVATDPPRTEQLGQVTAGDARNTVELPGAGPHCEITWIEHPVAGHGRRDIDRHAITGLEEIGLLRRGSRLLLGGQSAGGGINHHAEG